jgi:hypothetical protein
MYLVMKCGCFFSCDGVDVHFINIVSLASSKRGAQYCDDNGKFLGKKSKSDPCICGRNFVKKTLRRKFRIHNLFEDHLCGLVV